MPLVRARRSIDRLRGVATGALRLEAPQLSLDPGLARELFASQLLCRLTDVEAHELRARNEGYYTICSAGHEGNVALGHLTRSSDPALLHYRSGAFFLARARRACAHDVGGPPPGVLELLLSLAASADDPISGGRHKVFGSVRRGIPPQTSTIASHLPKAVGMAVAIDRAARLRSRQRSGAGACRERRRQRVPCTARAHARRGRGPVLLTAQSLVDSGALDRTGLLDECRRSGNVSEGIAAALADDGRLRTKPFARVTSADSFIPLAEAANLVLLQEAEILEAASRLCTPPS